MSVFEVFIYAIICMMWPTQRKAFFKCFKYYCCFVKMDRHKCIGNYYFNIGCTVL